MPESFDPKMEIQVTRYELFDRICFYARLGPTREDPLVYDTELVSKVWPSNEMLLDHLWSAIKPRLLELYKDWDATHPPV